MVSSGEIVREQFGHDRSCRSIVGAPPNMADRREDSTEPLLAQYPAVLSASHAARCVACHGRSLPSGRSRSVVETVSDLKLHWERHGALCLSVGLCKANYALDCGGSCTAASRRA